MSSVHGVHEDTCDSSYTQMMKCRVNNVYVIRSLTIYPSRILYKDFDKEAPTHCWNYLEIGSEVKPDGLDEIFVGLGKLDMTARPRAEPASLHDITTSLGTPSVSSIFGGYRPSPVTPIDQQSILAVNRSARDSTLAFSLNTPVVIGEDEHITFKRPDSVLRKTNTTLKRDCLVIIVNINPVEARKTPGK